MKRVQRMRSGWFGESYRHYLSAKGIPSGVRRKRYFVRDFAKGPSGQPKSIAIARSRGFSNAELQRNAEVRAELESVAGDEPGAILGFIQSRSRSSRRLPESFSATEEIVDSAGKTEELPEDSAFVPGREEVGSEDILAETTIQGVPMTGAPPAPSSPSSATTAPFKRKGLERWPDEWKDGERAW